MTDKQIIIDGVDVSGCTYYADGKCTNSQMIQSNCKNVAVCYYKEYKRKERECKNNETAHQIELDIFNQACLNLQEELKAKEQECEELKEKVKKYGEINEQETKDYAELKAQNERLINKGRMECLNCEYKNTKADLKKLKQTLTEIKEIVTLDKTSFKYAGSTISICDDILIKISEVEDDR